jgi:hypothetical protein
VNEYEELVVELDALRELKAKLKQELHAAYAKQHELSAVIDQLRLEAKGREIAETSGWKVGTEWEQDDPGVYIADDAGAIVYADGDHPLSERNARLLVDAFNRRSAPEVQLLAARAAGRGEYVEAITHWRDGAQHGFEVTWRLCFFEWGRRLEALQDAKQAIGDAPHDAKAVDVIDALIERMGQRGAEDPPVL